MANTTEKIPHISLEEFIHVAVNDSDAIENAQWVLKTGQDVDEGKSYPTRQEMTEHKLNESQWLLLTGKAKTRPGGSAGPLTKFSIGQSLKEAWSRDILRPVTIVPMIHGSLIPTGSKMVAMVAAENTKRADGSNTIQSGYELFLRHSHAETSCGPSLGDTKNTENGLERNLDQLSTMIGESEFRYQLVQVHPHGAYVGKRVGPMPGNFAFDLHNRSSLYFLPYGENEFMDKKGLDNGFRSCMDEGREIIVDGCIDRRQGLGEANDEIRQVNLEILREDILSGTNWFRKTFRGEWPVSTWQLEGHSEAPIVLLNVGKDEMMTRVGCFMLANPGAIMRNQRTLAQTAPMFVNLPEALFEEENAVEASIAINQITQLAGNLDREQYGRTLMKHNRSQFYQPIDDKLYQVDMPAGLQIAHSEKVDEFVQGLRIPKWFYAQGANPLDLNPKPWLTLTSRTGKDVGPVVR